MDDTQKKTAQGIVNIFETGRLLGNYGSVVVAANDPGHLTYGRSQTTLASGGLYVLINDYCSAPGAKFAAELTPYLDRLRATDFTLDNDLTLRSTLAHAGGDPVMIDVQDKFFDRTYWATAERVALKAMPGNKPVTSVLALATVYDSVVHGSFPLIKNTTNAGFDASSGENDWVKKYVATRRAWLANHSNLLLRKCVYRMDELNTLIAGNKWSLELPLVVRGITITESALRLEPGSAPPPPAVPAERASAQDSSETVLSLRTPYQTGSAVEFLQHALVKAKLMPEAAIDRVFGPLTSQLLQSFQQANGLTADGIVGPATWAAVHDVMQL